MALVQVVVGNKVAASDLNQIVQGLTGSAAHQITLQGSYSSVYAFTVWNTHADGLIGLFRTNAGIMLQVTKDGVRLSPDGSNFGLVPLTTAGVQTATNKSIDGSLNTITNLPTAAYASVSVTEPKLADNSVSTRTITADSVTGAKLGLSESAFAYRSSVLSIPDNVITPITWNAELWDTNTIHDLVTNTERMTCKIDGLYRVDVGAFIDHPSNVLTDFEIRVRKNGSNVRVLTVQIEIPASAVPNGNVWSFPLRLVATDYLDVTIRMHSNSAKNLTTDSYFGITRVGS